MKIILIILLIFISSCSTNENSKKSPCDVDARKFCSQVTPGDGRLGDCMAEHKNEISKECSVHIQNEFALHDEKFGPAMTACTSEHMNYCADVKKYSARRLNCMKKIYLSNPEKLSNQCRSEFSKIIGIVPPVFD